MGERLGIVVGQKLVDGHELVALGPKLRQGDLERLDRLAAIAAAVVHEHDIPRLHRQQALRYGIGAGRRQSSVSTFQPISLVI